MVKQIERHGLEESERERRTERERRVAAAANLASPAGNYWSLFGFLTEGWLRTAVERPPMTQDDTPIEPRQIHLMARTVS